MRDASKARFHSERVHDLKWRDRPNDSTLLFDVISELKTIDISVGDNATSKACMGEEKARMSAKDFESISSPRILKTHAPRDMFLAEESNGSLTPEIKVICK